MGLNRIIMGLMQKHEEECSALNINNIDRNNDATNLSSSVPEHMYAGTIINPNIQHPSTASTSDNNLHGVSVGPSVGSDTVLISRGQTPRPPPQTQTQPQSPQPNPPSSSPNHNSPAASPPPSTPFTFDDSLGCYNMSMDEVVSARRSDSVQFIAVGALVFSYIGTDPADDRVLLIQRAERDSAPLLWEIPGGGCEWDDPSVLDGAARELREETGLTATRIRRQIGEGQRSVNRAGMEQMKITFEVGVEEEEGEEEEEGGVEVRPRVRLNPEEHVRYCWATERECREGRAARVVVDGESGEEMEISLRFTTLGQRKVILEGFRRRAEDRERERGVVRTGQRRRRFEIPEVLEWGEDEMIEWMREIKRDRNRGAPV